MERLAAAPVQVSPRAWTPSATPEDREEFMAATASTVIPKASLDEGPKGYWLGIDAGSTTIKAVVIDSGTSSSLRLSEGRSRGGGRRYHARRALCPAGAARSGPLGTRSALARASSRPALTMDEGEIEFDGALPRRRVHLPGRHLRHRSAARDMKYLRIHTTHAVDSISVSEGLLTRAAPPSEPSAQTMGTDDAFLARMAMESESPVDLGTRCAVFANSSVKQALKEGADVRDISAGCPYSVVRNAATRSQARGPRTWAEARCRQGGTFLNDSVLRAASGYHRPRGRAPRHRGPHGRMARP